MEIPCFKKEELEQMAYQLKAVAHPNRLMIVGLLSRYKELTVTEICERMECGQALISHHLTDMFAKGILQVRREGRNVYYSIADIRAVKVMKCMMNCEQQEKE